MIILLIFLIREEIHSQSLTLIIVQPFCLISFPSYKSKSMEELTLDPIPSRLLKPKHLLFFNDPFQSF